MYISQRIEIKPNKSQQMYLEECFDYSRYIYNKALEIWNKMYENYKKDNNLPKPTHRKVRDIIKTLPKQEWELLLPKMIIETATEDLGKAFNMMWKTKSKHPKFKSKKKSKKSFRFYKKNKWTIQIKENKKLQLNGFLDKSISNLFKMTENIYDLENLDIKEVTISYVNYKYYASFVMECSENNFYNIDNDLYCGIDLGIKSFAIVNGDDGLFKKYDSLNKKLIKYYKNIDFYNKVLSRKVPGSNHYEKTRIKLNHNYLKIKNIRKDYIEKITTNIVTRYKYICIEDLQVSNMIKNKKLSRKIAECNWYTFKETLIRKSKMYGNIIIIADKWFPSTQLCSNCGHIFTKDKKLKLSDRVYKCPECGEIIDRDFNASINLKQYGKRFIGMANEGNIPFISH